VPPFSLSLRERAGVRGNKSPARYASQKLEMGLHR